MNVKLANKNLLLFFLLVTLTLLTEAGCGGQASPSAASNNAKPAIQTLTQPGTVSATKHPLVASYSVSIPQAGEASVEFGTTTTYGRSTQAQAVPVGGGTVTFLVAGMRAQTTYHMRARVDLGGGNLLLDSDHTFTTGALPNASFPVVSVSPVSGATPGGGVELISGTGIDVGAAVLDTTGAVIWYYYDPTLPAGSFPFPIAQLPNGNYLINFNVDVREVDLAGNVIRKVTLNQVDDALAAAGYSIQVASIHHDALRLSNGHWILLANEYEDFQDLPGYPGTTTVSGDDLIDLDTNNQVVWVWRAFDHLDVNRHPYLFPDWTHSNAIVYTRDGNLLLSMRHQSWVLKIDYANGSGSGDILWRLGPQGDFTLSNTDPAQWFYNQHFPVLLQTVGSQFRLALYDNGDIRPDSTGQPCTLGNTCYSRGIIMNVNESTHTASVTWQYAPGWYSPWGGSIGVLPNGDVEFDSSAVDGGNSSVIEVTQSSSPQAVWQMDSINAAFYRAYRIPSLYPGVQW
jgi:arylsulfate sulfotransferase